MTRAMHAARGVSRAKGSAQHTTHPIPRTDLYGRWLWRGGSTRSHPELGSENPLRGWYCRGHPVGEYGAAGLIVDPRPLRFDRGGRGAFCIPSLAETFHAEDAEEPRERQLRSLGSSASLRETNLFCLPVARGGVVALALRSRSDSRFHQPLPRQVGDLPGEAAGVLRAEE